MQIQKDYRILQGTDFLCLQLTLFVTTISLNKNLSLSLNSASIKENKGNAAAFHECPKQMLAEPSSAKPVSEFVSDYADDRSLWLS